MTNKHFSPSIGEFSTQERAELLARVEEQAREIERLSAGGAKEYWRGRCMDAEMALKAQPSGVVLPEQEGSHAQISFWAGYELAVSNLHNGNIRTAWNDFKGSDQFRRISSTHVSAGVVDKLVDDGWRSWQAGDKVRYIGSGEHGEDCHLRMTIGSDYVIHEEPDECETMVVLDDDGDEWSVLVGEFEWQAGAAQPDHSAQSVPDGWRDAAENCAFVMRYIGSMEPEEIDGDTVELRFEDEDGCDTGADASIVEYAGKVADILDAMLADAPAPGK